MKVLISNDFNRYYQGKSDGIIFSRMSDEDAEILKTLAEKYGKQVKTLVELADEYNEIDNTEERDLEVKVKKKEKKVWVHSGKTNKRVNESELKDFMAKGYLIGKAK